MGGGSYSSDSRMLRAKSSGFFTKSRTEIFSEKSINNAMNPFGVKIRESRDSNEHPNSLAIILALDVTGSMGTVPESLVRHGLPKIMEKIIESGEKDPQVLFLAIGDHECDRSPLQVGQFESSDELLDHWLTKVYIESGGGGNSGESYLLAWYFAGHHTEIDCWEKRKRKGFLFTIGDEPTLKHVPKDVLKALMGDGQYDDGDYLKLLEKAKETYDVYHLHIRETGTGSRNSTIEGWKQILSDNLIVIQSHENVADTIASIVIKDKVSTENSDTQIPKESENKEDITKML